MKLNRVAAGAVVVAALAGCGHSQSIVGASSGGHESDGTATGTDRTVASSSSAATGAVDGRFRIAGGPYPGTPHPIDGTISVHAGSTGGKVVTTVQTKHGRFTVTLPPGRYSFTGRSGQLTQGPGCPTDKPISVHAGETTRVIVQCDVP